MIADPDIALAEIELSVQPSAQPSSLSAMWSGVAPIRKRPAADGGFRFDDVCLEQARVLVTLQGNELLALDPIRVCRSGAEPDPRLDPIDLRGTLSRLSIDVVDGQGRGREGALVLLRNPSVLSKDPKQKTVSGRARFLVPHGVYEVHVELAGFRRAYVPRVSRDVVVQLQPSVAVRVLLKGQVGLPPSPHRLLVAFLADVPPPLSAVAGMGVFDGQRETAVRLSSIGRHEIAWYLEVGKTRRFLVGTPRKVVQVADAEEEQVFHLDLDPEVRLSWERTLASLEQEK